MSFAKALPVILKSEGGFVDHRLDKGHATNKGITTAVYNAWRKSQGQPPRSVKDIGDVEVEAIYRSKYWDEARCDDLPWPVSLIHFDSSVQHGVTRANKLLQKVLGVTPDGIIGPRTIEAAKDRSGIPTAYQWARLDYYARIVQANPSQSVFIVGWVARVKHLMEAA